MGRRFPGSGGGASGGGGNAGLGEFNMVRTYSAAGSFTWTKPTNLGGNRIRVYVWGAGGGLYRANARNVDLVWCWSKGTCQRRFAGTLVWPKALEPQHSGCQRGMSIK